MSSLLAQGPTPIEVPPIDYVALLPLLAVVALALTLRQTQTLPQKGWQELKGEQA